MTDLDGDPSVPLSAYQVRREVPGGQRFIEDYGASGHIVRTTCNGGLCLQGLQCYSNLCVDVSGDAGEGTGSADDADAGEDGGEAGDGGEEGDGGAPPKDVGGGGDEAGDGGEEGDGGEPDDGADGTDLDTDGGDEPAPACVDYAGSYCACLGEAAAPDCEATVADECDWVYDLCPDYWSCSARYVCSCDEALCGTDELEASCGTCK